MYHNYWACVLELGSCNYWAPVPQLLKPESRGVPASAEPRARVPQEEKSPQWEAQAPQLESSPPLSRINKALTAMKIQHSQK